MTRAGLQDRPSLETVPREYGGRSRSPGLWADHLDKGLSDDGRVDAKTSGHAGDLAGDLGRRNTGDRAGGGSGRRQPPLGEFERTPVSLDGRVDDHIRQRDLIL